jgi:serine/threonine protein kinase
LRSIDSIFDLIKEVESSVQIADNPFFIQVLGISQDPQTQNYMIVKEFASGGSLYNYLNINTNNMTWEDKIQSLWCISNGLYYLHDKNLIHQDLYPGNLLFTDRGFLNIENLSLCKSTNQNSQSNEDQISQSNKVYGALPYMAPEFLEKKNYTMESDIYSFGIITYELITGTPPYHEISCDNYLALSICQGLRPVIPSNVPPLLTRLMTECWDAQPDKRPTSKKLFTIINKWLISDAHVVFDEFNTSTTTSQSNAEDQDLVTYDHLSPMSVPDFD